MDPSQPAEGAAQPLADAGAATSAAPKALPRFGDRFQSLRQVGQGGMGTVFEAIDSETGQVVAIKWMRPPDEVEVEDDPMLLDRRVRRFHREYRIHARVDHPGCIAAGERGDHQGLPWYSMEFVEGTSLRSHLGRPLPELLDLVVQLASALEHIHGLGIIHRDLKPSNVIVQKAQEGDEKITNCGLRLRLTDFGIAKDVFDDQPSGTRVGTILGTLNYLSPEQAQSQELDPRSDLYALGLILYEALTGAHPLSRSDLTNLSATLLQIVTESPPPAHIAAPEVPEAVSQIVMRLLAKDRADRYASAGELIMALGAFLSAHYDLRSPIQPASDAAYLLCPPLIGREREIDQLRQTFDALRTAPPASVDTRLIAITAPAGTGKTRLLSEATLLAHGMRYNVLEASSEHRDAQAYGPLLQILDRLVRGLLARARFTGEPRKPEPGDSAEETRTRQVRRTPDTPESAPTAQHLGAAPGSAELTMDDVGDPWARRLLDNAGPELVKLLPQLEQRAGYHASVPLEEAGRERLRLYNAVAEIVAEAARSRPLCLVVEDLHRADGDTLQLLMFILLSTRKRVQAQLRAGKSPSRLIVLASWRSESQDENPQLQRMIKRLEAEALYDCKALAPLGTDQVRRLVYAMLGTRDDPTLDATAQSLRAVTGGNPFFIGEALQALRRGGTLRRGPKGWAMAGEGLVTRELPGTAAEILEARVAALSPELRRLLEAAAVVGRELPAARAAEIAELKPDQLLDQAERLVEAGFLSHAEAAAGRHDFEHEAVRELIYAQIPESRRRALHERTGEALKDEGEDNAARAGWHLARGLTPLRALPYLVRAGERARRQVAWGEAMTSFEEALRLTDLALAGDEKSTAGVPRESLDALARTRHTLLEHLGEVSGHMGRYEDAQSYLERAVEEARSQPAQRRADLRRKLGYLLMQSGDPPGAVRHCEDALEELGRKVPRGRLAVRGVMVLELVRHIFREATGRRPQLREDDKRREDMLAEVRISIPMALAAIYVDVERAAYRAFRAKRLGEALGDIPELAAVYSEMSWAYCVPARFPRAIEYATRARRIAKRCSDLWGVANADHHLGVVLYMAARWTDAEHTLRECLTGFRAVGDPWQSAMALAHLTFIHIYRGELDTALANANEEVLLTSEVRDKQGMARSRRVLGWTLCHRGEHDQAVDLLEDAVQQLRGIEDHLHLTSALTALGYALCKRGDTDRAIEVLEETTEVVRKAKLHIDYATLVWPTLAEALLQKGGRLSQARAAAKRGVKLGGQYRNHLAFALRMQARCEAQAGNVKTAARTLDRAEAVSAELGGTLERARVFADRGALLRGSDPEQARKQLEAARRVFKACGAHGDLAALQRSDG